MLRGKYAFKLLPVDSNFFVSFVAECFLFLTVTSLANTTLEHRHTSILAVLQWCLLFYLFCIQTFEMPFSSMGTVNHTLH